VAHSGKRYPVHFRRDFNLNSRTNNVGFGRGYRFSTQGCLGDVGLVLSHTALNCTDVDAKTFDGLKWESTPRTLGGRLVHVQIVITWDKVNKRLLQAGQLIDSVKGTIGKFSGIVPQSGEYGQLNFAWDAFFHPEPTLFGATIFATASAKVIEWSAWNNL